MKTAIAMTTYNGEKYILELLNSLLKQKSYIDEVVIYDDNSTDRTYEIIKKYIIENHLFNWNIYRNNINIGWKKNFRQALSACHSDLIFLCDQDDIWKSWKIKEMKQIMEEHKEINLLLSNYSVIYENRFEKVKVKGLNRNDGSLKKIKFNRKFMYVLRPGCTFCVKKELVELMQKYDSDEFAHDSMLWNMGMLSDTIYLYNRNCIEFRRHEGSASAPMMPINLKRKQKDLKIDIKKAEYLLEIVKHEKNFYGKKSKIKRLLNFLKKRLEIIETRSLIRIIIFQIKYFYMYPTLRNLLSDIYIIMLRKW